MHVSLTYSALCNSCRCVSGQKKEKLTGDKEHDSRGKGAVESLKGGEVCKGHDASDDACKARHP